MIHQAFTIYDSKAAIYSPPFFQGSRGLAIRMFTDAAKDPKTTISRYPLDFTLFYLGEYDDCSGLMIPDTTPTPIIKASETIDRNPSNEISNDPSVLPGTGSGNSAVEL